MPLPRPLDADELMSLIEGWCRSLGLRLDYVPVTISYSGAKGPERKVYEGVRASSGTASLRIRSASGNLEKGEMVSDLLIEAEGEDGGVGELLARMRALETPPAQAVEEAPVPEAVPRARRPRPEVPEGAFMVLVVEQGAWGQRIVEHLIKSAPAHWALNRMSLPRDLPMLVDEPSALLPREMPYADLVLLLSEHPSTVQLLPGIVLATGARAAIAPIDNPSWMPLGEANRVARLLKDMGVASAFPRPFCTLAEVGDEAIDEFARYFGAPLVEIESLEGKVKSMTVHRGAPCGCTEFVAERMEGAPLQESVERAGLLHHHYPCLASMAREEDLGDTLMHISGQRLKQDVEREVRKRGERRANYLEP